MNEAYKITLAQLNPTVGDLTGNCAKAVSAWKQAKEDGAVLLILPEMFVTGYQTQDLVAKPAFLTDTWDKLLTIAKDCADGPALGIGCPLYENEKLYNAYFILKSGEVKTVIKKYHLPNEDVFDEKRLFSTDGISGPFAINDLIIGVPVCEDAWHSDVVEAQSEAGAEIFIVPNGSPYRRDKTDIRYQIIAARVVEAGLPVIYLNMVGAQDDQVFDGGSFILNRKSELVAQFPLFEEHIETIEIERHVDGVDVKKCSLAPIPDYLEQDYHAMVLGLRDYMRKTGFKKILLGLSGGIDSAIVASIAADALGVDNVRGVMMPSEYTSEISLEDAREVATLLGIQHDIIPIKDTRDAITDTLAPLFEDYTADVTEENIQSRIRGLLLMAMSNKFGEMLLTTGNKSEVAVGYATIYGDMSGGYNPIKDIYKTRVFEICRWRNEHHRTWMLGNEGRVIPERIITKPPTAELRLDQKDEDSLPPYDILDGILTGLVDNDLSVADLVQAGYDRDVVKRVEHLIYISEYKRFQSAPGPRLSKRAFWLDRRYPIVNKWRDPS